MPPPTVYDHVSPTGDDYPDGVYRVVGTGGAVALLRLTDGDGRRVHTGELVTVDAVGFEDFEPVDRPTPDRSFGARVASVPALGYWSLRAFGQQLRTHPRATAITGAAVLVGLVGSAVPVPSVPDPVFGALLFVGSLGLAYVGGYRRR
jgi:hypothetical protein